MFHLHSSNILRRLASPAGRHRAFVAALASFSAGVSQAECGEINWSQCAWQGVAPSVFTDMHVAVDIKGGQFGDSTVEPLSAPDSSVVAATTVEKTFTGLGKYNTTTPVDVELKASAQGLRSDYLLQLSAKASGAGSVTYEPNRPVEMTATWDGLYTNSTDERVSLSFLSIGRVTSPPMTVADRTSVLTVGDQSFVNTVYGQNTYMPHLDVAMLDPGESVRVSLSLQMTADFAGGGYNTMPGYTLKYDSFYATLNSLMATPVAAVPEPATLAMFAVGLAGLGALTRRKRRQSS